jgi:hypothetical protein
MTFLAQNWFYILIVGLFVAMHLFGFGCGHTGHQRHHQGRPSDVPGPEEARSRRL